VYRTLWQDGHNVHFYILINEVICGACLTRPDPEHRFFVNNFWSSLEMGAVLLQLGDGPDSIPAEKVIALGGSCAAEFTKTEI
jgi:hypothetical protein